MDLHGIVSVWTLSLSKSIVDGSCVQLVHDTIVFTTSSSTHFLKLVGLDMEEYELTEIGDVATEDQSLYISNVVHGQVRVYSIHIPTYVHIQHRRRLWPCQ